MRLLASVLAAAVLIGFLAGGTFGNLVAVRFRWPAAGLAAVALQFAPFGGVAGQVLLIASFLLLLVVASVNRRLPGFPLVIAGLCLNLAVIAVNGGMPVSAHALEASGQAGTLADLQLRGGSRHHLATDSDHLVILADTIPIPPPVRQAVSVGDLVAYAGAFWFVVSAMRRRSGVPSGERPRITPRRHP